MSDLLDLRSAFNASTEEFLALEHKHLSTSLLLNEERGEKRVNVFFALIAAVTAALGLNASLWQVANPAWIVLVASGVFLIYGLVTLRRLVNRNLHTTELLNGLRRIRAAFLWTYPDALEAVPFVPSEKPVLRERDGWGLEKAGFVEIVVITNCLLVGTSAGSILYVAGPPAPSRILTAAVAGLVSAAAAWFLQIRWIRTTYARNQAEDQEKRRDALRWWYEALQKAQ